jgi:hypothetical protein
MTTASDEEIGLIAEWQRHMAQRERLDGVEAVARQFDKTADLIDRLTATIARLEEERERLLKAYEVMHDDMADCVQQNLAMEKENARLKEEISGLTLMVKL